MGLNRIKIFYYCKWLVNSRVVWLICRMGNFCEKKVSKKFGEYKNSA